VQWSWSLPGNLDVLEWASLKEIPEVLWLGLGLHLEGFLSGNWLIRLYSGYPTFWKGLYLGPANFRVLYTRSVLPLALTRGFRAQFQISVRGNPWVEI